MALMVPNLDDRRFQDLVDDAKRLVQQRCPDWTDHNVSDPGVTLIELFAWMTEQLTYRLNRVPDRNYVKFLELIGVSLFPPTAARTEVTLWLTAPQPDVVRIPEGTQVATIRTETEEAIVFATTNDLPIVPCSLAEMGSMIDGKAYRDQWAALEKGTGVYPFKEVPQPGDALYIGLSDAVPSNAVRLRFKCHIEGVGVDPNNPPLTWEAWSGDDWEACELDSDTTGGLNRDGDVILHVPPSHTASLIAKKRAGWLRARVTDLYEGQPAYQASPSITGLSAITIGGTTDAVNADPVRDEEIGISEGVSGQRFSLKRQPVVPSDEPAVLEVSGERGWEEWQQVADFAESREDDKHFVLDLSTGEVRFGPAVRLEDGTIRYHGKVPEKKARLRIRGYRTGGGRKGNVAAKTLSVLKSSIPFVARVENRRQASGGVEAEDIENAKLRGPIRLRTRGRAVTTEDYEHLGREAAPEVARIRAVAAGDGADAGSVRVLVVPATAPIGGAWLQFDQLVPSDETLQKITDRLEEARVIGTRAIVEPPVYRGVTVVAKLRARPRHSPTGLMNEALSALYAYFDPIVGGPEGTGWPFGRPVNVGEVYSVLQALPGTEVVEDARLFGADPVTGQRGQQTTRLQLEPHALVFSYEHQIMVEGA
jgi:predicted phage baseplate assembly protein